METHAIIIHVIHAYELSIKGMVIYINSSPQENMLCIYC